MAEQPSIIKHRNPVLQIDKTTILLSRPPVPSLVVSKDTLPIPPKATLPPEQGLDKISNIQNTGRGHDGRGNKIVQRGGGRHRGKGECPPKVGGEPA